MIPGIVAAQMRAMVGDIEVPPTIIGQSFTGGQYIGDITTPSGVYAVVMSLSDGFSRWGDTVLLGASSFVDGLSNTDLVAAQGFTSAAKGCRILTIGGKNDWYLPARDELNLAWVNRASLTLSMAASYYWSSTEAGLGNAWLQAFWNGSQSAEGGDTSKGAGRSYRAVRRIKRS